MPKFIATKVPRPLLYILSKLSYGDSVPHYYQWGEEDVPYIFTPAQQVGLNPHYRRHYSPTREALKYALDEGYITHKSLGLGSPMVRTEKPVTQDFKPRRNGVSRTRWPWTINEHWVILRTNPFAKLTSAMGDLDVKVYAADIRTKTNLQHVRMGLEDALLHPTQALRRDWCIPQHFLTSQEALTELLEVLLVWPVQTPGGDWRFAALNPETVAERRTARLLMKPLGTVLRELGPYAVG